MFQWLSPSKSALKELQRDVARLNDRLDELHSEHRKLRGRFYAARGELTAPENGKPESKAEILQRIGYLPGRPAPHNRS